MGQNRHKSLGAACSLFAPPSNSKRPLVKASSLIFAQVGGLRLFEVFSIVLSDIYVRFDSARRRIVSPKRPCSPNPTLNLSRHANQPRPQPSPLIPVWPTSLDGGGSRPRGIVIAQPSLALLSN